MEMANLIISILSLISTIAISFVIYFLEKNNQVSLRRKEIKDNAHKFILDNIDEIDYLHWATIAVGCFLQNKHVRKIYNEFSLLDDDTKKEVLKQRGMSTKLIENDDWVDSKIALIKEAIKCMDLGNDFLYDGGKYLTRAYDYKELPIEQLDSLKYEKNDYEDVFGLERPFLKQKGKLTYIQYLEDYLYCKYKNIKPVKETKIIKPNDYLIGVENLRNCDERYLCFWMMLMVSYVACFAIRYLKWKSLDHSATDARAETYEDRYFSVLYELYYLEKE